MRKKKPQVASPDEVTIRRKGEYAIIDYNDPTVRGVNLKIGKEIHDMTDGQILDLHNDIIRARNKLAEEYEHIAIEIPEGKPQISYFEKGDQWTPRGDVLRCAISDGGPDGEATIYIDDRELSLREFGKLLTTYAGWGMRIVFVPEEQIHKQPAIETRDVDDEYTSSLTDEPTVNENIMELPRFAKPSIDDVVNEFMAEQRDRLKPATLSKYERVTSLLRDYLNGYAYEGLSKTEAALFEKHYNATGKKHREFCQIFGSEKILENLGGFLGYFIVSKVMAGEEFKRAAGTVSKKLSKWLGEKGYVSENIARQVAEEAVGASADLVKAERAAMMLIDAANKLTVDPSELHDEDYYDFDHYTISRVEPGKLWLEVYDVSRPKTLGPIPIPKMATDLLKEGWEISCALGRVRGEWRIVEMANVYP